MDSNAQASHRLLDATVAVSADDRLQSLDFTSDAYTFSANPSHTWKPEMCPSIDELSSTWSTKLGAVALHPPATKLQKVARSRPAKRWVERIQIVTR